jgi:hypothetical protein
MIPWTTANGYWLEGQRKKSLSPTGSFSFSYGRRRIGQVAFVLQNHLVATSVKVMNLLHASQISIRQ